MLGFALSLQSTYHTFSIGYNNHVIPTCTLLIIEVATTFSVKFATNVHNHYKSTLVHVTCS